MRMDMSASGRTLERDGKKMKHAAATRREEIRSENQRIHHRNQTWKTQTSTYADGRAPERQEKTLERERERERKRRRNGRSEMTTWREDEI